MAFSKFQWGIIISSIIIATVMLSYFSNESDPISNNVTLIVEIFVGLLIAIILYGISTKNELYMKKQIEKIGNIMNIQHKDREQRKELLRLEIYDLLTYATSLLGAISTDAVEFNKSQRLLQKQKLREKIDSQYQEIKTSIKEFNISILIGSGLISKKIVNKIKIIRKIANNPLDFTDDGKSVDISNCEHLQKMINEVLKHLSDKPNRKKSDKSIKAKISKTAVVGISASVDKTVYPLDSIIYARATLDKIIKDQKIKFEIFNEKNTLLDRQFVDPSNYDNPKLVKHNTFEKTFQMKGSGWNVDQQYRLKVTYGESFTEDTFSIDTVIPVLNTTSVCRINDKITVTVIDSDADKDTQKREYVGNTPYSKLTIRTSCGEIDGYKLRETGKSTAIFQGKIGVLRARKDGSIVPSDFDGKTIDKIQGTGINDGFIAGAVGEKILFTYSNKIDTVHGEAYISNLGAVVELDKKTYSPNDKVQLTIIAPDMVFDYTKTNEIGKKPECLVSVKTSKDQITGYNLVESEHGRGIFTGKIQLVDDKKPRNAQNDPGDEVIHCDQHDTITVYFNLYDDTFTASSKIKGSK